ncbi:hypothetical protein H1R20_g9492, partial [Candolleomyces eurysporus]
MPWYWPAEDLLLPPHLLTSDQLPWDTASERLVAAVLTASQRVRVSAKPAFTRLFCDLAKTLLVKGLVALSCEIAPPLPASVTEEIIYVPTRTSTAPAGFNALPDYVPPPDYMDLIIPYSLMFIWFIGMISLVAFSSGGLSYFKRTLQGSSSSRSHADKRHKDVRATSSDMRFDLESPVDQAFISLAASFSLRFLIPRMARAVGLLLLLYILFGGSLPLDFASQLFTAFMEAAQPVLRFIMAYRVNIFSSLAKTLPVNILALFPCDIGAFIEDLVLPLSPPAWPNVVTEIFVLVYEDLRNTYDHYPITFICLIVMDLFIIFRGLSFLARTLREEPRWTQASSRSRTDEHNEGLRPASSGSRVPENQHENLRQASPDMGPKLEPLVDPNAISPPAVYVVKHEITYKKLVYIFYEEGESTPLGVEESKQFVSHRQEVVRS